MSKKLRIVVACGSGVATSTLAKMKVSETCEKYGVDASIETCGMAEVESLAQGADVVLTTNRCDKDLGCPVMSVITFVTGIGMEKTQKELGELLQKVANEE